uniref:Uncharacterized protein n=1 Tax=Cacopsylla melanoneura TaxID=428564 RepID=A0A8D8MDI3_9HEMI
MKKTFMTVHRRDIRALITVESYLLSEIWTNLEFCTVIKFLDSYVLLHQVIILGLKHHDIMMFWIQKSDILYLSNVKLCKTFKFPTCISCGNPSLVQGNSYKE